MPERFVPLTSEGDTIGAAAVDMDKGMLEYRVFDSYAGLLGTVIPMEQLDTKVRVVNDDPVEVALSIRTDEVEVPKRDQTD